MDLAIVTEQGEVFTVVECLEEFNLEKPIARSEIVGAVEAEMKRIERYEREQDHEEEPDQT